VNLVSGCDGLEMNALIESTLAAMAVATATANSRRKLPASSTNEWPIWRASAAWFQLKLFVFERISKHCTPQALTPTRPSGSALAHGELHLKHLPRRMTTSTKVPVILEKIR